MMDVYLHGPLSKLFGEYHRFDIRSPQEAAKALDANYPGFARAFAQSERWQIVVDGDAETGEPRHGNDAAVLPASTEIHFYPIVEGEAALFALPFVWLGFGAAGSLTTTILGGLLFAGVSLGLSYLLKPKAPEKKEAENKAENNYAFSGPENVAVQGVAVPLIFGRNFVGSVVISAGVSTENLVVDVSGSGQGNEIKDNIASNQTARIIDLLGEGVIKGVVGAWKGIYLDGVPMMDANGVMNFPGATASFRNGILNEARLPGFPQIESPFEVGVELEHGTYETRSVINPDVDAVRFTVEIPALHTVDKDSGVVSGATVAYDFQYNFESAGWNSILGPISISAKTTSPWNWSFTFNFPVGARGNWQFRATRLTPPSKDNITDNVFWKSYDELIDDRVFYQHSAVVGLTFDAKDFSTIPQRVYDVEGLAIHVPTNYQTVLGEFYGEWDGNFAVLYATNPAWILYELITNNRFGLGDFCPPELIDKWAFYKAAVWCDQKVPDGKGGLERRYVCNEVISDQQEAFDLLTQMASIFRGFLYWGPDMLAGTSTLTCGADQPEDPSALFTQANVIDGVFSYSGSDIRTHSTQVLTSWKDPELLGQGRVAIAEDPENVSRYGLLVFDNPGYGITSESQALRMGRWELYTQAYEGETIQFTSGLDGVNLRPGHIMKVMDANVAGTRRGGRVAIGSGTERIYFDSPVHTLAGTGPFYLSCIVTQADKNIVQTRAVALFDLTLSGGYHAWAEVDPPFDAAPLPDTVFVLAAASLEATLWRCMTIRQTDAGRYEIEGVRHYPQKWDYVEKNLAFSEPDISDIVVQPPAVRNLSFVESLVQLSAISVGVLGTLSWTSNALRFEIIYRRQGENWQHAATSAHQLVDLPVTAGIYDFEVTPISSLGVRGPKATLQIEVVGLSAPPATPKDFRVSVTNNIAMFRWLPATELDVIIGGHYELRYSGLTYGATWNSSQTVLATIPGSASSAEATNRVGTWLLRAFDIEGRASASYATIINLVPDSDFVQWQRICENPTFPGLHDNTYVKSPQNWLAIASVGGGWWDDQTAMIDSWLAPAVDQLPIGANGEAPAEGFYRFAQRLDAGSVFAIRLSADILAFPYSYPDDFFDSRKTMINTWQDFDDVEEDLRGQAVLMMRTTDDDPASAGASWTDWKRFTTAEHTARGFEFACALSAPTGQNIGVETLCVTGDFRRKADEGNDIVYAAADKTVPFNVKFYSVPAVVVTVQNAQATDQIQIVSKTTTQFVLSINNPPGTQVSRVFDWHAQGA